MLKEQWGMIHEQIKTYMFPNTVKFFYKDATSLLDTINSWEGLPNLIILQCFSSDFHKHSGNLQVIGFSDRLVDYINKRAKTLLLLTIYIFVVLKVADVIILIFFSIN